MAKHWKTCGWKNVVVNQVNEDGSEITLSLMPGRDLEEAQANARLLAAAPELLAALQHVERFVRQGESGPHGFEVLFPPADQSLSLIRAAIAKATGE